MRKAKLKNFQIAVNIVISKEITKKTKLSPKKSLCHLVYVKDSKGQHWTNDECKSSTDKWDNLLSKTPRRASSWPQYKIRISQSRATAEILIHKIKQHCSKNRHLKPRYQNQNHLNR